MVGHQEQPFPLGCEVDGPVRAFEQLHAHGRLQPADLPADGGLGQEQILGGEGDAHASPNRDEAAQEIYRGDSGQGN